MILPGLSSNMRDVSDLDNSESIIGETPSKANFNQMYDDNDDDEDDGASLNESEINQDDQMEQDGEGSQDDDDDD